VWRNVERGEVRRTRLVGDTLFLIGGERTRIVPLDGGRFRAGPAPSCASTATRRPRRA
jgi:hypothetical protein